MAYMERMNTTPAIAKGRFHFTGITSLSETLFFIIIAYKRENRKKGFSLLIKTLILKPVLFSGNIVIF
uniref:hypothetical protein n=1 Tax=Clostridium sp. NkU-1 TaxID=1095009 RepID=UPI000B16FD69